MKLRHLTISTAVAVMTMATVPASATTVFNFTGGNSATSGAYGNTISRTVDGITVVASAWSSLNGAAPATAYLGQYSYGLGVTNRGEGTGGNTQHTVDNNGGGYVDFIKLTFSKAVQLNGAFLVPFAVSGPADNDAWFSSTNSTASISSPSLWNSLLSSGTSAGGNLNANEYYYTPLDTKGTFATTWLVGANRLNTNDGFKLGGLTTTAVPEPASWAMMIVGVGLVGSTLRRRKVSFGQAAAA